MQLSVETLRGLAGRKYAKDGYNQIELTSLDSGLAEKFTEAYMAISDTPPIHAPFTVRVADGFFEDISVSLLCKRPDGNYQVTWGNPDEWLQVELDEVEFDVLDVGEDVPEIVAYIKGHPDVTFKVYREDLSKNKFSVKGIEDNIGTLKQSQRKLKLKDLDIGLSYQIVSYFPDKYGYTLTLRVPNSDKDIQAYSNGAINKAIKNGLLKEGDSFTILDHEQCEMGTIVKVAFRPVV